MGSKTRSPELRGHNLDPALMKLAQKVCPGDHIDEFETLKCRSKKLDTSAKQGKRLVTHFR